MYVFQKIIRCFSLIFIIFPSEFLPNKLCHASKQFAHIKNRLPCIFDITIKIG